jgi:aconitate hydratase
MGVLPLVFKEDDSVESLGLGGEETITITGIEDIQPRKMLNVKAQKQDGAEVTFEVLARLDSEVEVDYFRHGGILPFVLRKLMAA